MNLFRILVIVAIVWLSYRIYQNWKAKVSASSQQKPKSNSDIKNMVQCAKCGVHIPEHEAVKSSNEFYCCESHKN